MSKPYTGINFSSVKRIEVVRSSTGYVDVRFFTTDADKWEYTEVTAYRGAEPDNRIEIVVKEDGKANDNSAVAGEEVEGD